MSYFIFDMDETLAELYSVYYFIASLKLKETISSNKISSTLLNSLDKAYNNFVSEVLRDEISDTALGILRPGILYVMQRLLILQMKGKIQNVIIYSNNGHLESLEFIRDLIHKYLGTSKLIKECIHWDHPMRINEINSHTTKTWDVLKQILIEGNCKAPTTIEPKDIFFFDDLDHSDLHEKLESNYYKVPAYGFKASFDRLSKIYEIALIDNNVNILLFQKYIEYIFVNSINDSFNLDGTIDGINKLFKSKTKGTSNELPPVIDDGINMMIDAIKRVEMKGGSKRKLKTKGTKKNSSRVITRVKKLNSNTK